MDLALNNLQRLICHKPNNQPTNFSAEIQSEYSTAPTRKATYYYYCIVIVKGVKILSLMMKSYNKKN